MTSPTALYYIINKDKQTWHTSTVNKYYTHTHTHTHTHIYIYIYIQHHSNIKSQMQLLQVSLIYCLQYNTQLTLHKAHTQTGRYHGKAVRKRCVWSRVSRDKNDEERRIFKQVEPDFEWIVHQNLSSWHMEQSEGFERKKEESCRVSTRTDTKRGKVVECYQSTAMIKN